MEIRTAKYVYVNRNQPNIPRSRSIDPFDWYGSFERLPDNGLYVSGSSAEKLFVRLVAACGCELNFHLN